MLGAPLFDQAVIRSGTGPATKIKARNNRSDRCYSGAPQVNGKPHTGAAIAHQTISEGGEIVFEMSAQAQS